jgi:transposase
MMKSSMSKIEPYDANDGPVVSEGGRSPSMLSPGHGGAARGALAPGQRWSVGRKREVVLRLLRGESAELLSRELGVPHYRLEQWRQKADAALDGALKERHATDRRAEHGKRTAAFAHRAPWPFGPQEVAVMATAIEVAGQIRTLA